MSQTSHKRNLWSHVPVRAPKAMAKNFLRNWYFPFSALCFFYPEVQWNIDPAVYRVSLALMFLIMCIVATQVRDLWQPLRTNPWYVTAWVLMSAAGLCWRGHIYTFTQYLLCDTAIVQRLAQSLPDIGRSISLGLAVGGFLFAVVALSYFWCALLRIFREHTLFASIHPVEWVLYALLALAALGMMAWIFMTTSAFYTAETGGYDVIYTSDSGSLVKNMGYLFLTFPENDLRQPLFAVFAAPFIGAPYFFSMLLSVSLPIQAMALNSVQVVLLFIATLLISNLLDLDMRGRITFVLTSMATYAWILASLMMEQYIIAYFYLALSLSLIKCGNRHTRLALWGAGSTLLTSFLWVPLMSSHSPRRAFLRWLGDMCKFVLSYVVLLLAFGRFDVIYGIIEKIVSLSKFAGGEIPFITRIYQYTNFVHDCFLAPAAGVGINTINPAQEHISWMLDPAVSINWIGVVIFALCVLSAILNHDKFLSRVAIVWIIFSVCLLVVLGWGTWENGLILYSLYFGWAFLVLLFQLVAKIEKKLHIKFMLPFLALAALLVLVPSNMVGLTEMIHFGTTYFPL